MLEKMGQENNEEEASVVDPEFESAIRMDSEAFRSVVNNWMSRLRNIEIETYALMREVDFFATQLEKRLEKGKKDATNNARVEVSNNHGQ